MLSIELLYVDAKSQGEEKSHCINLKFYLMQVV